MIDKPKIALCVLASLTATMIIFHFLVALPRYVLADPSAHIICYFWLKIETNEYRNVQTCSATQMNAPEE